MLVGIDLGGTEIKAGLVDREGRILLQSSIPTNAGRDYRLIIKDMQEQVEKLLKDYGAGIGDMESIGIGAPGLMNEKSGYVIYCTNLFWENVPLGIMLKEHFNKPVYMGNDANAAALAESLFGSTKSVENSVLITIGTGVGSGIIIGHKIYSGSHFAGSELGHMIVGSNFYRCNCGNMGCLETFASATAMIRYAVNRLERDKIKSSILDKAGDTENIDARLIFDAAKEGDQLGIETVGRMIKYLSIGIINIFNILDPDIVAIGGGVSKAGVYLTDKLKKEVGGMLFTSGIKYGDIVLAQLGNEAGLLGAAFLGINRNCV
ncbi:MAG: ROK family glucokinase [Clostridiaceae bacterium]|nr:ROK family glucokinase [Clostridiaceae bacterium]